jgi:hypothetical protein
MHEGSSLQGVQEPERGLASRDEPVIDQADDAGEGGPGTGLSGVD